jgi:hypothetical protein
VEPSSRSQPEFVKHAQGRNDTRKNLALTIDIGSAGVRKGRTGTTRGTRILARNGVRENARKNPVRSTEAAAIKVPEFQILCHQSGF